MNTYHDDDEHDRELRRKVNHMTMSEEDIERHTLQKDKKLKRFRDLDEGY